MAKSLLMVVLLLTSFLYAQTESNEKNKVPIVIEADSFEYDNKQKIAVYKDNVIVRKGDFTLWSNLMRVYFDENSKIKEIIAEGNVKFEKGLYKGKANKGIYNANKEIIRLIGNAMVKKKSNILEGDEIIYYMKEDKAVVIGKNKKVRTIIVPEEMNKKNKGKGKW